MTIFQQFIKSLYSTTTISRFRFQKIGKSILFVFFLSFLSILPTSFHLSKTLKEEMKLATTFIKHEVPAFEIKNGKLQTEKKQILKKEGDILFEYNPTSTQPDTSFKSYQQGIALLKDNVYILQNGKGQTFSYTVFQNSILNKETLVSFIETLNSLFPIIVGGIMLVMFFFSSFSYFMSTLFLMIVGNFLSLPTPLSYKHLFTLSCYCLTIPTVFFFITDTLQIQVIFSSFIFTFSGLFVLYTVIKELPQSKKSEV